MSRILLVAAAALTLSGCEAVRTIAPQTVAGFESNGLIGAVDGASGAILARCKTLDGSVVRVAVDGLSVSTGTSSLVDRVREARQRACGIASNVNVLVDETEGELPADTGATALNVEATPPSE